MTSTVAIPLPLHSSLPQALRRPRLLTACECSGTPFSEIARLVFGEGRPLDEVMERTGCGQTCTACVPDLHAYLAGTGE